MQTLYIDILIVLNIYVNFFLLRTTAKITHSRINMLRCLFTSAYGSIYSLMILLPRLNSAVNIIIKLFAALTIVAAAFGFHDKTRLLINFFCFIMSNFIFAGVIYAVYIWLQPSFVHFNNTYFYIDFSLLLLINVTAVLYFSLCIARFFIDKSSTLGLKYKIYVKYKGRMTSIDGLADTGNSLVDFFSGKPVIICSIESLSSILNVNSINESAKLPKGFRLIPYSTIGNSGMIPVFTPDEVIIVNEDTAFKKGVDVLIGIKSSESEAIFNPKLLKV
ncbi:MAG TPA: sigma-E processing peptidase SpoIIGA [Ruminococcus sp.]